MLIVYVLNLCYYKRWSYWFNGSDFEIADWCAYHFSHTFVQFWNLVLCVHLPCIICPPAKLFNLELLYPMLLRAIEPHDIRGGAPISSGSINRSGNLIVLLPLGLQPQFQIYIPLPKFWFVNIHIVGAPICHCDSKYVPLCVQELPLLLWAPFICDVGFSPCAHYFC